MKTIAVCSDKGGVGKTTTALIVSSILQDRGYKVLFIDGDQQRNATTTYGAQTDNIATLYDVLFGEPPTPAKEAIQHMKYGDIIAADGALTSADEKIRSVVDGAYLLKDAVEQVEGYDFCIIDTPKGCGEMVHSALVFASEAIIPCDTDRYSVDGVSTIYKFVEAIKKRQNTGLKIAGIICTKYDSRRSMDREVLDDLKIIAEKIGTKVFSAPIRYCVKTKESQALGIPLNQYAGKCTTQLDYETVVDELIGR